MPSWDMFRCDPKNCFERYVVLTQVGFMCRT